MVSSNETRLTPFEEWQVASRLATDAAKRIDAALDDYISRRGPPPTLTQLETARSLAAKAHRALTGAMADICRKHMGVLEKFSQTDP